MNHNDVHRTDLRVVRIFLKTDETCIAWVVGRNRRHFISLWIEPDYFGYVETTFETIIDYINSKVTLRQIEKTGIAFYLDSDDDHSIIPAKKFPDAYLASEDSFYKDLR